MAIIHHKLGCNHRATIPMIMFPWNHSPISIGVISFIFMLLIFGMYYVTGDYPVGRYELQPPHTLYSLQCIVTSARFWSLVCRKSMLFPGVAIWAEPQTARGARDGHETLSHVAPPDPTAGMFHGSRKWRVNQPKSGVCLMIEWGYNQIFLAMQLTLYHLRVHTPMVNKWLKG